MMVGMESDWHEMAENGRPAGDGELVGPSGDDALILALSAGDTVTGAAAKAGTSERTAYRRLADEDFRRAVSEARGRLFDAALGKLAGIAAKAADTLDRLMDDEKANVALGAAKAVLELGPRLRELTELEERLTRLESNAEDIANESAVRVIYDDDYKTANHPVGSAAGQTRRTDNNSGGGG